MDRQFLLAALRVWRAEVASGEARAAGQRAQAREEELERITCALPWWVRRVSERAALARFFLHWRLAGATGKRQGLEAWRRERDSAPGELPAPLRAEPVQRRFLEGHQRSEAFTEATRFVEVQRDRVGVPSEMGVSSEKGVPPELLSGMMGADGGDAIQAELRAIREMVHARLLELSQHDVSRPSG